MSCKENEQEVIYDNFTAPFWASHRHIQTLWGPLFRRLPKLPKMFRQRLELADGDFIDVDIGERKDRPTVLLLHGLEGSIDSPYVRGMIEACNTKGWQIVVMHFRSCSGEPNRLLKSYNSGVSEDLNEVIELLAKQSVPIKVDFVVGYSLGGNVTLKWLGEQQEKLSVRAAVAVSVPLMLDICAKEINRGFSKLYQYLLIRTLKQKTAIKKQQFPDAPIPGFNCISSLNSFLKFDNLVTAPAHGYRDGQDYYDKASSKQFVKKIRIPTLIIQSRDDPFMNESVLPDLSDIPTNVTLEANSNGGHVGFVQGRWPWAAEYYLEKRIPNFLEKFV